MMKAILAGLGVFAGLFKFRWLIALIPGAGPVLALAVEVAGKAAMYVLRGLFGIATSGPSLAAAIVIAMVATIGGVRLGVKLDAHLVHIANQERDTAQSERDGARRINAQWEGRLNDQTTRADAAEAARTIAESKAAAADAARERAQRLLNAAGRKPAAGQATPQGPSLSGLGSIFTGNK